MRDLIDKSQCPKRCPEWFPYKKVSGLHNFDPLASQTIRLYYRPHAAVFL